MKQFNRNQAINHNQYVISGTNQIKLVSFKNIDIWPSYGPNKPRLPIFGHTYFDHDSGIFGPIGLINYMGTIIYRLVIKNISYDTYSSFLIFWATKRALNSLGPPTPTKK